MLADFTWTEVCPFECERHRAHNKKVGCTSALHSSARTTPTRWLSGFLHVAPCQAGLQTSTIRGKPSARSTVASTAVISPDGRRRTKDRTRAAGPNVCAHVGCRDCSMSHDDMLADSPALHVVNFVRGLLWHPRPSLDRTSEVVRSTVYCGIHGRHVTARPTSYEARSTVASTAVTWPDDRRRTKDRTPAAGSNVCAHVGCRDCSVSHHGMLADSPALRVVIFVRALLWHPRPSLAQTTAVVRRTVRRQLALMYAEFCAVSDVVTLRNDREERPLEAGSSFQELRVGFPRFMPVEAHRRAQSHTALAMSIHHSLHKKQAPFSMWLLVPPRREVEFRVGCTRWLPEFLHVTPWQAGLQPSTIRGKPRGRIAVGPQLQLPLSWLRFAARSTVASTAVACTDGRRRTKDRTSAAGPNVCAHVRCRDSSMSHRGMPAAIRALHVGNFVEVRAILDVASVPFWAAAHHASHARSTVTSTAVTWPDNRRRTKGRTPAAGPNVCAHVGCRDCSTSHHGMLADSPALRVVNFMGVRAVLDVTNAPIWAAGDRGSHARSTVASTAVISPDGRRRTKDRTRAAGPNVCAHVGGRDCSMSHHAMLADSPALRVVIFVRGLLWHLRPSRDSMSVVMRGTRGLPGFLHVTSWQAVRGQLRVRSTVASTLSADSPPMSYEGPYVGSWPLVYAPTWAVGIVPCHTGLLGDRLPNLSPGPHRAFCRSVGCSDVSMSYRRQSGHETPDVANVVEFCTVSDVVTLRNDREERPLKVGFSFQELRGVSITGFTKCKRRSRCGSWFLPGAKWNSASGAHVGSWDSSMSCNVILGDSPAFYLVNFVHSVATGIPPCHTMDGMPSTAPHQLHAQSSITAVSCTTISSS
nr:uncharacterized protein LOC126525812 isoform X5 [Dermacentor andersoni]